jgi:hypothetical protein
MLAPLRLSVDHDDPHFDPIAYDGRLNVTLNGVPVKLATAYDRVEGWVEVIKTDDAGKIVFDYANECAVTVRVRGVVSAWIKD